MALSANDVLKVVVSLTFPDAVVAQNIFWALFEADGGSADEDDVLDDLETWVEAIYADLLSVMSDLVSLDDMKVYVLDTIEGDFDEVGDRTVVGVGETATEMMPHGVAAVTNSNTTNPDVQGRKFWGGFGEAFYEDGFLSAGAVTQLVLALIDWVNPFVGVETGSGFVPGVWSPTKELFYPMGGDTTVNLAAGYQRRRKPGVGI